jgi:hypothetical protein
MRASVGRRLARALASRATTTTTAHPDARARATARAYGQLSDPNTFELLQGPEGRVIIDKCVFASVTARAASSAPSLSDSTFRVSPLAVTTRVDSR